MKSAIRFENISKRYRIGLKQESFREALSSVPARLFKGRQKLKEDGYLWALRDINLEVEKGSVLGIIGSNGAGKTTMLKLMSNVIKQYSGKIEIDGRVSALIELGAGFHPDLTGLENIYLNGVILGLTRKEIDKKLDSIIEFAELEKFIHTPVKRYSSGMYARLGFSVAAHVNPDILLVDEVLAVGDEAFQIKCHNYIHSLVKESGRTSVFVSHNLYAIEQLCDRVIWMDKGRIIQDGLPSAVLRSYLDETERRLVEQARAGRGDENLVENNLKIRNLRVMDSNGELRDTFKVGEDIIVQVDIESDVYQERPYFCLWISDAQSTTPLMAANMLLDNYLMPDLYGQTMLTCHFRDVPLMPRTYNIWVEVYGKDRSQLIFKWRVLGSFRIIEQAEKSNGASQARGSVRFTRTHAAIKVPYEWQIEELKVQES